MKHTNKLVTIDQNKKQALLKAKNFITVAKDILIKKDTDISSLVKVWVDPETSMMWQVEIDSEQYSWKDSFEYVKKLNQEKYGGYSDWRVPSINELDTIFSNRTYNRHSCTRETYIKEIFLNSMTMYLQEFWSSSQATGNNAYRGRFAENLSSPRKKEDLLFVRCVRTQNTTGVKKKKIKTTGIETKQKALQRKKEKVYNDFLNLAMKDNK
jgi:serine/threonine-protein kinase